MNWREARCPKCGETIKIPWAWVLGVEMIFYCADCKQYLKINYKLGALLAGIGWALAFVSLQFIAYFTSAFTIVSAAVLFLPLGILFSFLLRRKALRKVNKRRRSNA